MRVPRMRAAFDLGLQRVRSALAVPRPHEWLLLALLLFMTDRYRWLMDDAFIYFRYVDNLLFLGRGLVYNPGEYAEGYSSPLWLLLLVPLRALQIDYYTLVRVLALGWSAAYGVGLIWLQRRLGPPAIVVNVPLAASAAHYGITTHFSSGLETPLVQAFAPLYAAALLRPRNRSLQAVVALAPLIRAEFALLCALFLLWFVVRTRRLPWFFLGFGLLANGVWLGFRVLYYADFLPNTYYLKDGANWHQGMFYWQNVSEAHHWPFVIAPLVACALWGRRELPAETWAARVFMLLAALLYGLYVTRIGGDMLYHRYAALPVCLALCAVSGFLEAAWVRAANSLGAPLDPGTARRAFAWLAAPRVQRALALCAAVGIAVVFGLRYPQQLMSHPFLLPPDSRKWKVIADPNWHRRHASLEYTDSRAAEDVEQRARYARYRAQARRDDWAPIEVRGFCRVAFDAFDAIIVHDYGLTEPVLARLPRPFGRPGHKLVQIEADQLAKLRRRARRAGRTDWYALPRAPVWVVANRDALVVLERKLRNPHALRENLGLAWSRVVLR